VGPKRYLAIETSSPRLSLAIGDDVKTLAIYTGDQDWRHSETLFEGIEKLLRRRKWALTTLSGVAVSVGPGSFTGIRIGLAVARALGQSLQIPVVGVSSLKVMAAGARTKAAWLAPQIDALRNQVFYGLYRRNGSGALHRVLPETMAPASAWVKTVRRRTGRQTLWISPSKGCYPEAGTLLQLARPTFAAAGPASYKSVLPLYIRRAAAEERKR
jgi:tRNA threonylcarbamoyladenosine biosynthesis protein TsaB